MALRTNRWELTTETFAVTAADRMASDTSSPFINTRWGDPLCSTNEIIADSAIADIAGSSRGSMPV
jgi:hypothetical protein